jgi:hypothetical protein
MPTIFSLQKWIFQYNILFLLLLDLYQALGFFHLQEFMSKVIIPTNLAWKFHLSIFILFPLGIFIRIFIFSPTNLFSLSFLLIYRLLRTLLILRLHSVNLQGLGGGGGQARGQSNNSMFYRQLFHLVRDQIYDFSLRGTDNTINM